MNALITEPRNKQAAEVFKLVMEMFKKDKEMQSDREQLKNVCCAPASQIPVKIQKSVHRISGKI